MTMIGQDDGKEVDLPSPGAVVKTAVHSSGTRTARRTSRRRAGRRTSRGTDGGRTTATASHMRRDVGAGTTLLLGDVETVHVQLISHGERCVSLDRDASARKWDEGVVCG